MTRHSPLRTAIGAVFVLAFVMRLYAFVYGVVLA